MPNHARLGVKYPFEDREQCHIIEGRASRSVVMDLRVVGFSRRAALEL